MTEPLPDTSPQPRPEATTGPAALPPLRLEVHRDWESALRIADEWDRFIVEIGGGIYLSPDWCRIWWKHYGRGEIRVFVVRHAEGSATPGAIAAVLPMFISRVWAGPVPLRLAKFVGSDSTIMVFFPSVRPELAEACYRLVLAHLLVVERCHAASFGPLGGEVDRASAIRRAAEGLPGPALGIRERTHGVHTIFRLPDSLDAWLLSLDRKCRYNLRRSVKRLEENFALRWTVFTDPAGVAEHFPRFLEMHTAQWRADGMPGHFGDWPGSTAFSEELVREFATRRRVQIVCLSVGERPVAYHWSFNIGGVGFWRLPARRVGEEELEKFGLGRVGLLALFEHLIPAGVRIAEAGPGHYDYKLEHGGEEYPLHSILVHRRSPYARLATKLALVVADALHLGYYRGWRRKVLPRVGLRPGPLWRSWIRTRF